jgi:GGDEF domain-containing protein
MPITAKKKFIERPDDDLGLASEEKFLRSLADLEDDLKKIEAEIGEDKCDEVPRCLEAKLSVELYRAEHDNAGAFKFKRFERQMIEAFEKNSEASSLPEKLAERRYIFVNMGELDRINKEGHGQDAGDAALAAAINAIDGVCLDRLGPERANAKNVFRYGGNEFCVELDNATDEEIKMIAAALTNASLDMKGYAGIEPPPLSVASVDLAEQFEVMRDAASALKVGPDNPIDLAIETVEALRRAADYNLEVAKFVMRIDRAVEKIKAGPRLRDAAETFFNNYLRKSLQGTELETLEMIEQECDKPGFREVVELMAVNAARARFGDDRKFAEFEDHLVNVRLLEISRELSETASKRERANLGDKIPVASIPRMTTGLRALERARNKMIDSRRDGSGWAKKDRLAYEIEAAKRDRGTGFLERGQFYGDWNGQLEEAVANGADASVIFVDMGFLKYFNDAGGRPVGDAALRKSAQLMELAIEGARVRGVAYRYGGDEFAIRVYGSRAEAETVVDALMKLGTIAGRIPDLAGLRSQSKPGEPEIVGDSRVDYAPTELVFNAGIAELADFRLILSDLRESGELNTILTARNISESEFRAELMVKLADASVGFNKAVERFETLIELMKAPTYQDGDSPYHARVESIIRYSQKAILSGLGGDAALRVFAESDLAQADLKIQIERFVADRIEKTAQIVEGEKALADKLIELHAVRNRLIKEAEQLAKELGDEHERVQMLRAKLDEADSARAALIAAKNNVAEAAIDKKPK